MSQQKHYQAIERGLTIRDSLQDTLRPSKNGPKLANSEGYKYTFTHFSNAGNISLRMHIGAMG